MKRLLAVLGTRPEAIKMAPVVEALRTHGGGAEVVVCSTGQHREMLDATLAVFGIEPDLDLGVMTANQDLSALLGRLLIALGPVIAETRPDHVVAQGDTTTVMAAGLAAFAAGVPFAHVEAGLRTRTRRSPFPEELNRRVADLVADAHFVPTERAREALRRESVPEHSLHLTGNTVIDALLWVRRRQRGSALPAGLDPGDARMVLITAHRRESFGQPFRELCTAIRELAARHPDVQFVYPVHLNPNVRQPVLALLSGCENIVLTEPRSYPEFVALLDRSTLVLTDSGGVQEEAPSLGKPVVVMRETTERPEAVAAGGVRLVGTDRRRIVDTTSEILEDAGVYAAMAVERPVYGDGLAARRIAEVLVDGRMLTPPFPSVPVATERSDVPTTV